MTDGVKARARKALEAQQAPGAIFRALVIDLLTALDAGESQLQGWIDVATTRQNLIDQLKAENRRLVHEVERLKGETASLEYMESVATGISEKYRPVYEALKGRRR